MTRYLVAPFMVIAINVACAGDAGESRARVVRDSAGIRIVENRAPIWDEVTAWRLGTDPALDIGVAEGDRNYELSR